MFSGGDFPYYGKEYVIETAIDDEIEGGYTLVGVKGDGYDIFFNEDFFEPLNNDESVNNENEIMMDIKEFRIGNCLKYTETQNAGCVITIHEDNEDFKSTVIGLDVSETCDNGDFFVEDRVDSFEPILLTPELVQKCGFKKDNNDNYFLSFAESFAHKERHIEFEFMGKDVFCSFWIGSGKDKILMDIKYLHQLQNFYFALSGKELVIDLRKI